MHRLKNQWIAISLGLVFGAGLFWSLREQSGFYQTQFYQFNTQIEVQLDQVTQAKAEQTFARLNELFATTHVRWSAWGDGALGQLNQQLSNATPDQNQIQVPAELAPLIQRAAKLSRQSLGFFAPETGLLVKLWGFDDAANMRDQPPQSEVIKALVGTTQPFQDWLWQDNLMQFSVGAQLDFGGFIKGAALDEAIVILSKLGVENAMVNAGGDLRAIGQRTIKGKTRPWQIGIKHPRGNSMIGAIAIDDGQAVFTSGDYERFFEHDGRRFHHILNPKTGWPGEGLIAATVVTNEGALADAAATALLAAGLQDWQQVANSLGLTKVMVTDANNKTYVSQAMHDAVWFDPAPDELETLPW